MIINVVKYLILGAKEDIAHFFERAQEGGFLEFISISGKKTLEQPVTLQNLYAAIRILRKQPLHEPYLGGGDLPLAMQISERILELKEDLERLYEEQRMLEAEISRVAPFGDFSLHDLEEIEKQGKRKIQFFCRKSDKENPTTAAPEVIYITTEYDLDYFISINPKPTSYPDMIEMRIDAPLGQVESRLNFVKDAIHRFEVELKEYAGHIEFLQAILVEELNGHHLGVAKKEVSYPLENSLFAIEAWIPENKVPSLFALIEGMAIHAEQIIVEKGERVPTCLENSGFGKIGEDLIQIYDVPSVNDKDSSSWVVWAFAFFFAIIVGDAGYGLLYFLLALYLRKKFPDLRGQKKRMLKLLFLLATTSILWGVAVSSYLGISIKPGTVLSDISPLHFMAKRKAEYHMAEKDDVYEEWVGKYPSLKEAKTGQAFIQGGAVQKNGLSSYPILEEFAGNILLELSLFIGVVHLTLAFLRYLRRNISGLGWIAVMIGGYLYAPSILNATSFVNFMGWVDKPLATAIGTQLIYGGIGFAVLAAIAQRGWKAWVEIMNLVQVFSDVLSYVRLYALSFAGGIMASTFNQEGSALGLVAGAVVILAGHCVNFSLGLMGGVIHGLRLNFLEWYHYCFEGSGRLFKPLKKIKRS